MKLTQYNTASLTMLAILEFVEAISSQAVSFDYRDYETNGEKEISPEEAEVDGQLAKLRKDECFKLLGDCWLLYKRKKFYLPEEIRLKQCLKNIKGFVICESMSDSHDQVNNAIAEAEWRQRIKEEEQAAMRQKDVERNEKLAIHREQLEYLWSFLFGEKEDETISMPQNTPESLTTSTIRTITSKRIATSTIRTSTPKIVEASTTRTTTTIRTTNTFYDEIGSGSFEQVYADSTEDLT